MDQENAARVGGRRCLPLPNQYEYFLRIFFMGSTMLHLQMFRTNGL